MWKHVILSSSSILVSLLGVRFFVSKGIGAIPVPYARGYLRSVSRGLTATNNDDLSMNSPQASETCRVYVLAHEAEEEAEMIFLKEKVSVSREEIWKLEIDLEENESRIQAVEENLRGLAEESGEKTRERLEKKLLVFMNHQSVLLERLAVKESKHEVFQRKLDKNIARLKKRLRWCDFPDIQDVVPYSVTAGHLYFVEQKDAVKSLLSVHRNSFMYRSFLQGGLTPQIPVIEGPWGIGKSTFAARYIESCRKLSEGSSDISDFGFSEFRDSILSAKTVAVRLGSSSLGEALRKGPKAAEKFLVDQICKELRQMLKSGKLMVGNDDFARFQKFRDSASLLETIIAETGFPLFVILDGIWDGTSEVEKFSSVFFSEWIKVSDLYFVLVGTSQDLMCQDLSSSRGMSFQIIEPLTRLSPRDVEEVLSKTTKLRNNQEVFLTQYFDIKDHEEMQKTAEHIHQVTKGNPRETLLLLKSCENRGDILNYKSGLISSPTIKSSFSPFRDFISIYGEKMGDVKLDHPANFELCCLKRFQEMFHAESSNPGLLFADWFQGTVFGQLKDFSIAKTHRSIPKITEEGKTSFSTIEQETLRADNWPELHSAMEFLAPQCFIPRDKSAATDVLIMSRAIFEGEPCIVTVGLAVKCYSSSQLSGNSIHRELSLFDRMFESEDHSSARRLNFLFICCTGNHPSKRFLKTLDGSEKLNNHFSLIETDSSFPHITEAVYLDLSTEELRAKFFGICKPEDSYLRKNLEDLINKNKNEEPPNTQS